MRVSAAVLALALALLGCEAQPPAPELERDEQLLVDTYVRLTLLEALHAESPDSVEASLRRLRSTLDTTAVRSALASLAQEPLRWERIYDAIALRLSALESEPEHVWWRVVAGDSGVVPTGTPEANAPAAGPDH